MFSNATPGGISSAIFESARNAHRSPMNDRLSWSQLLRICPHRAVVSATGFMRVPDHVSTEDLRPTFDADGATHAFLGFGPIADFGPAERGEILARLRGDDGALILLVAMSPIALDSVLDILERDLLEGTA